LVPSYLCLPPAQGGAIGDITMLAPPEKPDVRPEKPAEEKRRTITLTNHRPISIRESQWPVIAEGSYCEEDPQGLQDLKVEFRVRCDNIGRHIIHGKFEYWNEGNETGANIRVGRYLPTSRDDAEKALREVGAEMTERVLNEYMHRWITVALDACFANLGPQVL
jgi:hypothetical protein